MKTTVHYVAGFFLTLVSAFGFSQPSEPLNRPDFSGMWNVAGFEEATYPNFSSNYSSSRDGVPFTEAAQKNMDLYLNNFDIPSGESAVSYCYPAGMPATMLIPARDYVFEIYQTQEKIFVFLEFNDEYRVIHLDEQEVPEQFRGSRMGYSLGRWDGDVLEIRTTALTYSSATEFPKSELAELIERWSLVDHPDYGKSLSIRFELNDPEVYTEKRYFGTLWRLAPEGAAVNTYGCNLAIWEDFVSKRLPD